MRDFDVAVLARFPEIFEGFRASVNADCPECGKYTVWDRDTNWSNYPTPRDFKSIWNFSEAEEDFRIARNANLAWGECNPDNDIVYAGDDTRIIQPDTLKRLQAVAYSDPKIGIVAPRIQSSHQVPSTFTFREESFVAFVFVYIKRDLINRIGMMDERFDGYGWDDVDYCYRARRAGWKIGFAPGVTIQHGVNGLTYGCTFKRVKTDAQMIAEDDANMRRFADKWELNGDRAAIWNAVFE